MKLISISLFILAATCKILAWQVTPIVMPQSWTSSQNPGKPMWSNANQNQMQNQGPWRTGAVETTNGEMKPTTGAAPQLSSQVKTDQTFGVNTDKGRQAQFPERGSNPHEIQQNVQPFNNAATKLQNEIPQNGQPSNNAATKMQNDIPTLMMWMNIPTLFNLQQSQKKQLQNQPIQSNRNEQVTIQNDKIWMPETSTASNGNSWNDKIWKPEETSTPSNVNGWNDQANATPMQTTWNSAPAQNHVSIPMMTQNEWNSDSSNNANGKWNNMVASVPVNQWIPTPLETTSMQPQNRWESTSAAPSSWRNDMMGNTESNGWKFDSAQNIGATQSSPVMMANPIWRSDVNQNTKTHMETNKWTTDAPKQQEWSNAKIDSDQNIPNMSENKMDTVNMWTSNSGMSPQVTWDNQMVNMQNNQWNTSPDRNSVNIQDNESKENVWKNNMIEAKWNNQMNNNQNTESQWNTNQNQWSPEVSKAQTDNKNTNAMWNDNGKQINSSPSADQWQNQMGNIPNPNAKWNSGSSSTSSGQWRNDVDNTNQLNDKQISGDKWEMQMNNQQNWNEQINHQSSGDQLKAQMNNNQKWGNQNNQQSSGDQWKAQMNNIQNADSKWADNGNKWGSDTSAIQSNTQNDNPQNKNEKWNSQINMGSTWENDQESLLMKSSNGITENNSPTWSRQMMNNVEGNQWRSDSMPDSVASWKNQNQTMEAEMGPNQEIQDGDMEHELKEAQKSFMNALEAYIKKCKELSRKGLSIDSQDSREASGNGDLAQMMKSFSSLLQGFAFQQYTSSSR